MDVSYLKDMLARISRTMEEHRVYLIGLDRVVGDGDLGLTMAKGFAAASEAAAADASGDAGRLLYQAGKAMSAAAPSTMGTLMALGLMQGGKALKGKTELSDSDIADFLAAYEEAVQAKGKAKLGEKTFLDAFHPAVAAFGKALSAGDGGKAAFEKAALAAEEGFRRARTMRAVHGKAAVKGEDSREMDDPGAAVAVLMMQAAAKTGG